MENPHLLPGELARNVASGEAKASALPARFETIDAPPRPELDEDEGTGLLEYWHILRRRKGTIIVAAFLGALAGLLLSLPQTPIYQARASVEIQGINENFMYTREVDPNFTPTLAADYLQTQVKILQSESLLERVVAKLRLEERPEFAYEPTRVSAWRQALGLPPPSPLSARERALATATRNLKVRVSPQTRLVEILVDSTDPRLASDFANVLANEFIDQNLETRWGATQRTGEWLKRQLDDLKIKLEKSEEQLQNYARTSGLMFTAEKENVAEERLRQLQEELSRAQGDRVAKQSQYEMATSSPPESLPDVLNDASLRDYQGKITDLKRQLAELRTSLTPAHYKVKRVQAQIAELETALEKERGNILKRIRNEYESAQRRETLLANGYAAQAKLVSEQAAKVIHYNILKREVDTNRQLYDSMLQKVKEAGIASAMRATNIRVVDSAKPPTRPYKPNHTRNAMFGLLAGIFLGVVFVFVRESADRTLKAPGDAMSYLNVPELGVIPSTRTEPHKLPSGRREVLLTVRRPRRKDKPAEGNAAEPAQGGVELVTWQRKPSLLAESFRATLTSILFSGQNGNYPRVLVLTSPGPEDGKTTMVSNLGLALAEINRKVLLLDADLRKPRLHDIFEVPNDSGLSDLLRSSEPIEGCPLELLARETKVPGLYVLPSGSKTHAISNLLYSARTAELMRRLRREFDAVLIDTPPMLHIADARVLGRLADAVVLVLRAGLTTRDGAVAAKQRFAEDGTPVLGTVLNYWDPDAGGYGYYDKYYYYRRYYNRYEDGEGRGT
jgi:capsular exopolysaccharide synthesis family protein